MGRPVHPEHRLLLCRQGPGASPLLVPADAQRGALPEPRQPAARQRARAPGDRLAINRADVSQRGESGYEPPANQTGIVLPTYQAWYDKSIDTTAFDVAKADQTLEAAGFTKGSDGIYKDAQGQRLSFTIKTISGYTDWDSSLKVIQQQLKAAGIEVSRSRTRTTARLHDRPPGRQLPARLRRGDRRPAALLRAPPDAPERNIGSTNYSRYKSAATDALFAKYPASSPADQVGIIKQIEQVMVNDSPVIPVTEGVDWYQYDTTTIGGWPTPDDPYALPAVWALPDNGVVLTHLYPTNYAGTTVAAEPGSPAMRFVARRLGLFLLTLWAALTINFLIPRLMPGNEATAVLSHIKGVNPAALHALAGRVRRQRQPEPPAHLPPVPGQLPHRPVRADRRQGAGHDQIIRGCPGRSAWWA